MSGWSSAFQRLVSRLTKTSPANPGPAMSDSTDTGTPSGIVMYESKWCGFCRAARRMLDAKGWNYESRNVDGDSALRAKMTEITGKTSVPQIFFGDQHVGGFDDMAALEKDGKLDSAYAAIK